MSKPELPADDHELIEKIWQEQVRSLEQGSMTPAENFFKRYPVLADRADQAIDVIFNEFAILSGTHLKRANPEDFYRRFPKLETQLRKQFELFEAVNEVVVANGTSTEKSSPPSDVGETSMTESDGLKDRFEFQRELGRGATSVVYAACGSSIAAYGRRQEAAFSHGTVSAKKIAVYPGSESRCPFAPPRHHPDSRNSRNG